MFLKTAMPPVLEMGFRPFFFAAGVFAVVSMMLWSAIYLFAVPIHVKSMTIYEWHAHEMFYGYAFAVIVGFLLTSVRTWTKLPTAHNTTLLLLFLLWLSARILFVFEHDYLLLAASFDILFALSVSYILTRCIIKAKQWKQLAIISKLLLITLCNIVFYLGALGYVAEGVSWGIFGGLYIVIALILTMGRRVIPFFIERASSDDVPLTNSKWVDVGSMVLFIIFAINELFIAHVAAAAYVALLLLLLNAYRLILWHRPIIWKQSLLWSIYLAFWMITLGFALIALSYFVPQLEVPRFAAVHAFTVGGIGIITLGMMSRVALAHTGHNVYEPPKAIAYALAAIVLSAVVRIILPLLNLWPYDVVIAISQVLWIVAFLIFSITYAPILFKAKRNHSAIP